ncbi:MAG: peptidyl-prolyl cis-trans isomerase [Acidobacteriota bacterium]|jgi:cyclophilin family peptidyl-prolyl cis-trans isomerase|nr:peptidyl-prolyl cis-trans isomerase [Acidobacteriota bacterium]
MPDLLSSNSRGLFTRCVESLLAASLCLAVALCLSSCGGGGAQQQSKLYDEAEGAGGAPVKSGVKPEPDAEAAVFEVESNGVSYGRIVIELYPNIAPKMVERFKTLVREGFYNGTAFHRINPRSGVVQGGDPNSKDDDPSNDGLGDSPYPDLPAEFSDIPFDRGTVGAARQGPHPEFEGQPALSEEEAANTANCQFYITLHRVPQWDAQYTVFGKVIEGMDNAQVIAGAPTRPGTESPADKIIIKSATLQPRASFK